MKPFRWQNTEFEFKISKFSADDMVKFHYNKNFACDSHKCSWSDLTLFWIGFFWTGFHSKTIIQNSESTKSDNNSWLSKCCAEQASAACFLSMFHSCRNLTLISFQPEGAESRDHSWYSFQQIHFVVVFVAWWNTVQSVLRCQMPVCHWRQKDRMAFAKSHSCCSQKMMNESSSPSDRCWIPDHFAHHASNMRAFPLIVCCVVCVTFIPTYE